MADSNSTQVHSIQALRSTIETMDALSQEGFSRIAAIASLALLAVNEQDRGPNSENIRQALHAICDKARDIENCINYEAEKVGCNYVDPDLRGNPREASAEVSHA